MTDRMTEFLRFASANEELTKKVNGMKEQYPDQNEFVKASIALAQENGYTLTEEDFAEENRELSADELENVAGGSVCGCSVYGGGASTLCGLNGEGSEYTCACFIGGQGSIDGNVKGRGYYQKGTRCVCAVGGYGGHDIIGNS